MKRNIMVLLKSWQENPHRKPLILKGARQVGKTYILHEFGKNFFPDYLYVNFEENEPVKKIFSGDLNPQRILAELSFAANKPIDPVHHLIIFDEIQECPRALTSLKYFCEKMPEVAICCAGSLLGLHFGENSFPVGKVEFLNLYPLSFTEFLAGIEETKPYEFLINCNADTIIPEFIHDRLWELLKIYFITGGLPEAVNTYRENKNDLFHALQTVRQKQENLILSYEADMGKHSGKQNSMHINRLWRNTAAQLAREQNGSASKFQFKDVIPGIKGYERLAGIIDWLKTAGLIIKTPIINNANIPFSAYTCENFFKLYFFDIGLLGAISKLSPATILNYDFGSYKGYFAENFVAQEFLSTCNHTGNHEFYCWRENTAEVEFLREIDGRVIPIEIKSGWVTQAKSLKIFAAKYQPDYRVIMSAKNLLIDRENQIHYYPLYLASLFPLSLTHESPIN